jgi:hypothetical protein
MKPTAVRRTRDLDEAVLAAAELADLAAQRRAAALSFAIRAVDADGHGVVVSYDRAPFRRT